MAAWAGIAALRIRRRRRAKDQSTPGGASGSRAFAAGQTIGPYVIEREIGRGAVGVVLLARHALGGDPLALKTLSLPVSGPLAGSARHSAGEPANAASDRFFRAAELARRLHHPNIAAIRDAGVDRGIAYLAMELARGCDLTGFTQPGRLLPAPQVLEIGAAVAQALAHAHRAGVVHRDLKPSNILFDAVTSRVTLTDFGIARAIDSAIDGPAATRSGLLLGTVAFMSPEQLAGARVGAASDFYSLAATVFLLLTGRLPHEAASMSQQMHAIANQAAPDLRSLRPDLPPALADSLSRLLSKAQSARLHDGPGAGDALAAQWRRLAGEIADETPHRSPTPAALSGALPAGTNEAPVDPRHNSGLSSSPTGPGGFDPHR